MLVMFEHNPLNPLTRRIVSNCAFDEDAHLLWPWQARRLLVRAGLTSVQLRYVLFFPERLGFLNPFEPYLGRVPLGAQIMCSGRR